MNKVFLNFLIWLLRNTVLKWSYNSYKKSLVNIESSQDAVLKNILKSLSKTEYGKSNNIKGNESYKEFIKKIPINTYETLRPFIEKDYNRFNKNILPTKPIIWENTSGSSGKIKHIPYSLNLLNSFRRMFLYWVYDLITFGPQFKSYKTFISISAPLAESNGFDSDLDYLPPGVNFFFGKLFVFPKELNGVKNPHQFRLILARTLVRTRNLEIISIWSPTYLLSLIDFINENREEVLLGENIPLGNWESVWPELKLISTWADGSASYFIPELKKYFPNIYIQSKGLLATEAPLTFPSLKQGQLPLANCIFYEFLDDQGYIYRLHELKENHLYTILFSNNSGLYRYNIFDQVKVKSFTDNIPNLIFIGRSNNISDLTGEKLSEVLVEEIFKKILPENEYAFLLPSMKDELSYFCVHNSSLKNFHELLDKELMGIFHYKQSIELGQLKPLKTKYQSEPMKIYFDFFQSKGINLGDIKFSSLVSNIENAQGILKELYP